MPENLKLVGGKLPKNDDRVNCKFNMAAPAHGWTSPSDHCRKGRWCSKLNGHKGRCNSEKNLNAFWKTSPVYNLNVRKRSLLLEEKQLSAKAARLDTLESELREDNSEMQNKLNDAGEYFVKNIISSSHYFLNL